MADQMLQVALSQGNTISPDSLFWLAPVPYENEIIVYNGKEYKKSELCNATLHWLELSEQERMFSSYFPPEFMIFEENWGVTLNIDNITPTSASIVCRQEEGEATGELQTGSWYIIENWTQENGWKEVVNPFTTGIPIFGGLVRVSLIQTRGFRFRRVTWRCESCGFEAKYRLT